MRLADNPNDFINDPVIKSTVQAALKKAKKSMLEKRDHMLIISYLAAAIIYSNAQRPGIVQNMMISEYEDRQVLDGKILIRVLNHKTSTFRGPANVIITPELEYTINKYLKLIRHKITPKDEEYSDKLFLTSSGNEFKKISEKIMFTAKCFGIHVPTAGLYRKVIATEGHRKLSSTKLRSLNDHMAHSEATSKNYYQFPDEFDAVGVHDTIQSLSTKRYFSKDEDRNLLYEHSINNDVTPTLDKCDLIVKRIVPRNKFRIVGEH